MFQRGMTDKTTNEHNKTSKSLHKLHCLLRVLSDASRVEEVIPTARQSFLYYYMEHSLTLETLIEALLSKTSTPFAEIQLYCSLYDPLTEIPHTAHSL